MGAGAAQAAGGGGFLRNAASIGAGVLGGSLLFQGIESLLHGGGFGRDQAQGPADVFETNNFITPPADADAAGPLSSSDSGSLLDAGDAGTDPGIDSGGDPGGLDFDSGSDFGADDDWA